MAKAQDYTKALNDFMGTFPVDLSAYQDAFKNSAELGEKLSSVALQAAEKSTEFLVPHLQRAKLCLLSAEE